MIWKKMFVSEEGKEEATLETEQTVEVPHIESDCVGSENLRFREDGTELFLRVRFTDENQVGRAALLLASTLSKEEERSVKKQLSGMGWKSVATEVGGLVGDLPQKITRALVGAALNAAVVEKRQREMHALMHAAHEALNSFIPRGMLEASVGAKIAIVRNDRWVAVAVMGDTAYHAIAHHERCGMGVMHI